MFQSGHNRQASSGSSRANVSAGQANVGSPYQAAVADNDTADNTWDYTDNNAGDNSDNEAVSLYDEGLPTSGVFNDGDYSTGIQHSTR